MNAPEGRYQPPKQTWLRKFECAFVGIGVGVWRQSSFVVHGVCLLAILILAFALQLEAWRWAALLLASALVLVSELLNSALESLAKATTQQYCPHVDRSLKIASGAVLLAALFAIAIGAIVFWTPMIDLLTPSTTD